MPSPHIDAESPRHALVVDRGPHPGAEPRVLERQHEHERDRQRDADQEQPVHAEADAQDRHGAAQIGWHPDLLEHRAEDVRRRRDRDEREPDGEEDLIEVAGAVQPAVEPALQRHAHRGRGQERAG
jgi:hypothetical protein